MTVERACRDIDDFREQVRDDLVRLAKELALDLSDGTSPSSRVSLLEDMIAPDGPELERIRRIQAGLFDLGLADVTAAPQLGGRELPLRFAEVVDEELHLLGYPSLEPIFVGLKIIAPALVSHGSDALAGEYVRSIRRGEVIGCQLFSEPDAGSDLAGVRTRAVRDGDGWRVTGQKIWTSSAQIADIGEVLVRTDPTAGKHQGLSMFLVDMHQPGVEVRPIRQMTGGASFNEVYLDDAWIPDNHLIGELGQGWKVALTSLASERSSMTGVNGPLKSEIFQRLHGLLASHDIAADPLRRPAAARAVASVVALQAAAGLDTSAWDRLAPVAGSVLKMLVTRTADDIANAVESSLGTHLVVDHGDGDFAWAELVLGAPCFHIAGGTDQIQRNVISQRGLGLPRG